MYSYFPTVHQHPAPAPAPAQQYDACGQGHSTALTLSTAEGGKICLVCLSNLISNPKSPTIHVSYALSQLSQALAQPQFLRSFVTFHSHFLISPLVFALSAFHDGAIAAQIVDLILQICQAATPDAAVYGDFVAKVSDRLSSYSLAWSRQQIHILHCLGVLLECKKNNPQVYIKDKHALVSSLIAGLQLPSEDIQGEILFVLYKVSLLQDLDDNFVEVLHTNCAKLLHLSLEVLVKTEDDDVRLNCVAFLTVFSLRGWFKTSYINEVMDCCEFENFMQTTDRIIDRSSVITMFADAVKGPLLSSDRQVQVATLDLIFLSLSCRGDSGEEIQVLVEENIADYVFEILRLSGYKDPLVSSCIQVLELLSTAEEAFRQRLAIGFATLVPVLHYVADVPFHPVQTQSMKLVEYCISKCPGVVSSSQVEEISLILTGVLKKHKNGESGILPETFNMACSLLVALMNTSSSCGAINLSLLYEASRGAVLTCLKNYDRLPDQFLHALFLLKETFACSHGGNCSKPIDMDSTDGIIGVCKGHILPWFISAINNIEEEDIILGVIETFESILMLDSITDTKIFADTLVSSSWFSILLGCLGLFPSEKMKLRVYLIFSSIVNVLLGNDAGQPIRDVASHLPADPIDLLFLLGQKGSHDMQLFSCQSAVLLILYVSSLYDDRLADDKLVLASLEQYILLNSSDFLYLSSTSVALELLANLYGLYRGLGKVGYQLPYSPEAEKILFQLLDEKGWDLLLMRIHLTSLKWMFQQEKICRPLSEQMLSLCRCTSPGGSGIVIHGKDSRNLDLTSIAELITSGDNFGAMIFVCLFGDLIEKDDHEDDIISVVITIEEIIEQQPAAADQLCMHGIASPIWNVYNHSRYSSVPELFITTSKLVLSLLRSVKSDSLYDEEAWIAIVTKLTDYLMNAIDSECWTRESFIVIGILALVLHHSTNQALIEASKIVLLNTPLTSVINRTVFEACSKGPALIDYDEGTNAGAALVFLLLLMFFSLKSIQAVLPGITEWRKLLEEGSEKQPAPYTTLSCHDFCKLLHFGSPPVKLVSSFCLLEIFKRISDPKNMKLDVSHLRRGYLLSIKAILEGLVFSSDIRTSVNCSLCLSLLIDWEEQDADELSTERNIWCRMIVEELVLSLAVPRLASKSLMIHHEPEVNVAVALLKSKRTPEWMTAVIDDSCITSIIQNISTSNLSPQLVLLFRELLNSGFLKADHIASLNRIFQACRQRLYVDEIQLDSREEKDEAPDGLEKVCEFLVYLMSSLSSEDTGIGGSQNTKNALLVEIELFSKCLMEEEEV